MIELIHGIFISDSQTSLQPSHYKENTIQVVINCTQTQEFINKDIIKFRLPVSHIMDHNDRELLKKHLNKIMDVIQTYFLKKNILITCYDGKLISPLILSIFLCKFGNIKPYDISHILQSKIDNFSLDIDINQFLSV